METLKDKHILIGITGGIAAYKTIELIRRLIEKGAQVQVVMTAHAKEFVTAMTLQAVSGNPVRTDLFDSEAEAAMGHIELARWADLILVAPASADFMARLSYGHADDLLSTLCLATTAPIALAPAMNQQMWLNPATQENIKRLEKRHIKILGPAEGSQACGEMGPGRLLEPTELLSCINNLFIPKLFNGEKIIITAGPTREAIDPVRYISNRSSGKMGFALAQAAQAAGAEVILISGPVNLITPSGVTRIDVTTANEMYHVVQQAIKTAAIFIATAAVADYQLEKPATEKIKKHKKELSLQLIQTPDILASVTALKHHPFVIGFAAETENLIANAQKKMQEKKLNMIAANWVDTNRGFDQDDNQLTVLWNNGQCELALAPKQQLAIELISLIAEHYYAKNPS